MEIIKIIEDARSGLFFVVIENPFGLGELSFQFTADKINDGSYEAEIEQQLAIISKSDKDDSTVNKVEQSGSAGGK